MKILSEYFSDDGIRHVIIYKENNGYYIRQIQEEQIMTRRFDNIEFAENFAENWVREHGENK